MFLVVIFQPFGCHYYGLPSDSGALDAGRIHAFGRSIGYTYAKNGAVQQTVSTGYGADGRINSAGFVHGGTLKQFGYAYVPGAHLLQTLTKPNGMTLTQTYESTRRPATMQKVSRWRP